MWCSQVVNWIASIGCLCSVETAGHLLYAGQRQVEPDPAVIEGCQPRRASLMLECSAMGERRWLRSTTGSRSGDTGSILTSTWTCLSPVGRNSPKRHCRKPVFRAPPGSARRRCGSQRSSAAATMLLAVVNDPRPFNLTVRDLRAALDEANPESIVSFSLSPESVLSYIEAARRA